MLRLFTEKNSRRIRIRVAKYRKKNLWRAKLSARLSRLKIMGLPIGEINKARKAFFSHDGKCDSCGVNRPGGRGEWCIDHDHKKKVFRGVLCHGCNASIGFLRENPKRLRAAAKYLEKQQ